MTVRNRGSTGGFGTLGDPYLHIFNSSGGQVTANDDSEGTLNSLITITWADGYYIGASVYSSGSGTYQLYTSVGSLAPSSLSCTGASVKQNQTITFTNPGTRQYRPTFTVTASASSGLAVTLTSNTTGVCSVSGSTVTPLAVGTCTLTASQAGNGSYNAASNVSQSFSIIKADQTLTFAALADRAYSATPFTVSASATSGLTATFSSTTTSVCTLSGTSVTMVSSGTCTIRAAQGGDTVWNAATSIDRSFVVSKASQTITFVAPTARAFSTTPFSVSATSNVSGTSTATGLSVAFASRTIGVCTVSGTSVTMVSVGTCTLTASQDGDSRFLAAVSVEQSFAVQKASQTITFTGPSAQTYGVGTVALSATSDSGLTVAFSSSTTGVCTVSGSTATVLAAGTCTLVASQAGDAYYLAATSVTRSFTVAAKTLSISGTSIAARVYNGGTAPGSLTLGTLSGLVGTETLVLSGSAANFGSAAVGSPTSTVTFTLADGTNGGRAANYSLAAVTVTGSITRRPLTVTATSISRSTDSPSPTFAVTGSGLVAGETIATGSGLQAVPESGLVGYWSFNDADNFNAPNSGGSTLTKGNGASWTSSGKFGGALSLNGSSQSLYAPTTASWLPTGNSSYTQSLWFKPSTVNNGGLMGWGSYGSTNRTNALRMSGDSRGGFYNYWWDNDLHCNATSCPLSADTWYHVLTTYDGTTRSLYLNGELKATRTGSGVNATADNFHIGKTCCSEYFTGLIDQVAIYNRAVDA
ncbi:MAG: LamG-like jellyroll fold domain-containing protein, partial [Acidimicrobiia bacterium]